jgi:hypothetical protein
MSSSTPDPRPGNSGRWRVNRFAIGVLIGAIAVIIGFVIALVYLLSR